MSIDDVNSQWSMVGITPSIMCLLQPMLKAFATKNTFQAQGN